jgi:hypothetical protein
MKHIETPVCIKGDATLVDPDSDNTSFEVVVIEDQIEAIAYIPHDLSINAPEGAAEIVRAVNAHDKLVAQRDTLARELGALVNHRMLYRLDKDEKAVCTLCGERDYVVLDIPHRDGCRIATARAAFAAIQEER